MVRKRRCWIKQFQPYDKNQNKQPRCLHPLAMRVNYANAAASNTRHSVPQSYTQCNTRKMACAVNTLSHIINARCAIASSHATQRYAILDGATTQQPKAPPPCERSVLLQPCLPRAQTVLGVWSSCQHARRAYAGTVGARAPQLYGTGGDRRPSSCQHARRAYAGTVHVVCAQELRAPTVWHR